MSSITHRLARLHRDVCVAALEGLDARLLIDAHDGLVLRRLVGEAQHIAALLAELVVVRRQVHRLPMRREVRVLRDAAHRAVADLESFAANVIVKQRSRPVRGW